MITRFESNSLQGIGDKDIIEEYEAEILFNANFSANDKCPRCNQPKRKEQRESHLTLNGATLHFHVWKNIASNKFIIRDCDFSKS